MSSPGDLVELGSCKDQNHGYHSYVDSDEEEDRDSDGEITFDAFNPDTLNRVFKCFGLKK